MKHVIENLDNKPSHGDAESLDVAIVAQAKKAAVEPVEYTFTDRDVIIYNLGIGATADELQWVFEGNKDFGAIPTFGVMPQLSLSAPRPALNCLPNFNPVRVPFVEMKRCLKKSFSSNRRSYCMANNTCQSKLQYPRAARLSAKRG